SRTGEKYYGEIEADRIHLPGQPKINHGDRSQGKESPLVLLHFIPLTNRSQLLVILLHSKLIGEAHSQSVDYIEDMLYKQLVAAIGKEVTTADFTNYANFHNNKLFRPEFRPRAFCYAVRRPDHTPEG